MSIYADPIPSSCVSQQHRASGRPRTNSGSVLYQLDPAEQGRRLGGALGALTPPPPRWDIEGPPGPPQGEVRTKIAKFKDALRMLSGSRHPPSIFAGFLKKSPKLAKIYPKNIGYLV